MSITYEYSKIFTALCFVILALLTAFYTIRPRKIVVPYLVILLMFTGTLYGTLEADLTIYTRGSKALSIPLINIFLYFLFAAVLVRYGLRYKNYKEPFLLSKSLLFFVIIILMYFAYGFVTGVEFENIASKYGLINVINLYAFYLILKWWIFDEQQLEQFIKVFIIVTSFMAIYGIVRLLLFGGDPANYYLNQGKHSVSITYFDQGQGLLFGVFFVILYHKVRLRLVHGSALWFYYFMMGLSLLTILLSFRRNLWLGLSFIFIWIFLTSNATRKVLFTGVALAVLAVGSGVYQDRFGGSSKHKEQSLTADITNKSGKIDLKHGRFAELANAMVVANQHSIIGLGPWGVNTPRVTPYKDTDFVHSSILHVYIKTGIIGVLAYLSLFIGYAVWWLKIRNKKWHSQYYRSLGDAFFCGLLMEVSDIMFGTPLIIFRHSQILAILLVMPYLCYRLDRAKKEQSVNNEQPVDGNQAVKNKLPLLALKSK